MVLITFFLCCREHARASAARDRDGSRFGDQTAREVRGHLHGGAGAIGTRDESSSIRDFLPAVGIKAANYGNGGFGTPPFFGQSSDKPLLIREV
jgi:hypothetical protein